MIATQALLIAASFASSALAQGPPCSTGPSVLTFRQCARDALITPSNIAGANDATEACASLRNDQSAYYNCLCTRSRSTLTCYETFCMNDPGMTTYQQFSLQYCNAASANPPTASNGTGATSSTSGLPTMPTLGGGQSPGSTTTTSASKSTGTPAKNDAQSATVALGTFAAVLAVFI